MIIKDFVDDNLGDEKQVINTFVDNINENGGIDGHKIVPDIKEHPPIPGRQARPALCDIAEKAAPDLTPETGRKTVDSFGPIQLVPNRISSLGKGTYAATAAKSASWHCGPGQAPHGG